MAIDSGDLDQFPILGTLSASTFASNAAISIYATKFICLCLHAHHRSAVRSYGVQVMSLFRYRCVRNLLVQFAVVRVPIAIAAAVALGLGMGRTTFAVDMIPIAASSQVCLGLELWIALAYDWFFPPLPGRRF
jgi:hypothetical protein